MKARYSPRIGSTCNFLIAFRSQLSKLGAPEETRTPKIWLLRPTRIPIPSPGQNLHIETHYSSAEQFDCSAVCFYMVPDVGIELTTYRLQGGCSTTELIRQNTVCKF